MIIITAISKVNNMVLQIEGVTAEDQKPLFVGHFKSRTLVCVPHIVLTTVLPQSPFVLEYFAVVLSFLFFVLSFLSFLSIFVSWVAC